VFALAYVVGARAGTAAFGALVHYILIVSGIGVLVWLASFPVGAIGGRVGLARFVRATVPAQAVAISTQSSLASLPAMLRGAEALGVPVATSGVILPLAVAIFRVTGPPMNLAVAIYVAYWFGIPLGPSQLAAGVAVAAITTMGAVSLPGQISYVSSIAPICIAMGVPIAPLGLLVAVETIPDIFRTLGNVTMDLAATRIISVRNGPVAETEGDALLKS
jgi:Na+/H+-dicarboxylate symporter